MVLRASLISLFALSLLPTTMVRADEPADDALTWLNRMALASASVNYDGTFVYVHEDSVEAMRIMHKAGEGGGLERLISLNGSPREVVRKNNVVTCYLPHNRQVVVEQRRGLTPLLEALPARIGKVREYYELALGYVDRVAGLRAQEIVVTPKDQYRFGYRLWLDVRNGMLLKSQMLNEQGHTVEQIMFTNFTVLSEMPEHWLQSETRQQSHKAWITDEKMQANAAATSATDDWHLTWLPEGFELSEKHTRNSSTVATPIQHFLVSDGFATVSVFVEKSDEKSGTVTQVHKGAINAYSAYAAGFKITTVGEVPMQTVKRIAQAVKYTPGAAVSP